MISDYVYFAFSEASRTNRLKYGLTFVQFGNFQRIMHKSKTKAVLLFLLSGVASLILSLVLITGFIHGELSEQRDHFTRAIVHQLTASTADYLVTEDLLGLNVVLGSLVSQGDITFASVYNTDNKLLAQAGKRSVSNRDITTRDITFQNETAGYLQVVVNQTPLDSKLNNLVITLVLIHLLLLGAFGLFVWVYPDLIFLGLFSSRNPPAEDIAISETPEATDQDETDPGLVVSHEAESILLVMKIRPQRWLAANEERISNALSLYRCEVEVSEGQDIIATFLSTDRKAAVYDAICAGLLLIQVFNKLNTTINIKIGIHIEPDMEQLQASRKRTAYLASIAERQLLISEDTYALCQDDTRLVVSKFHNSLMPTGTVYLVESLQPTYQRLIELQADQLARS